MARTRKRSISEDLQATLVERALGFYDQDTTDRQIEMDMRAQRYAKYRQWEADSATDPWEGAADTRLGDMLRASLRMQDTLYNAVISTRPVVVSKATERKNVVKQEGVDDLLDYQAFVENKEEWVSDLVDAFVNDGHFTVFTPWVKEKREASIVSVFPALPDEMEPVEYFSSIIENHWRQDQGKVVLPNGNSGWSWIVVLEDNTEIFVDFWTAEDKEIEMIAKQPVQVFDGPKIMVLDRADVLHPVWAANLQPPGPSNPQGAPHVVLVSRPTVDEVRRLQKNGFYDLLPKEDAEALEKRKLDVSDHIEEVQKDVMAGNQSQEETEAKEHQRVTRLMVFDIVDLDGNGVTEDVVYWVLKEEEKLLRVRRLSEVYPHRRARRPFAEEQFIPVRGRRTGIGLLEIAEPSQDQKKMIIDLLIDSLSMGLTPFGFYRPSGSMNAEIIRLAPGELYPLTTPKDDVYFPPLSMTPAAMGLNVLSFLDAQQEKTTMQGDLQSGRVPRGKASALRTTGSTAMILSQGEARPERILRRFFHGISNIFSNIHELNTHFIKTDKVFRVTGVMENRTLPYRQVTAADLDGFYDFEFNANAFNTSKQVMQEALLQVGQVIINPVALQLGTVSQVNVYNWQKDMIKAWGQDYNKYITAPVSQPMISVEEVLASILDDTPPRGYPSEGLMPHLEGLQMFMNSEMFGLLEQHQIQLFTQWVQTVMGYLQQEAQNNALAQAAGGPGGQLQGPGQQTSAPGQEVDPALQENELADETLPSSGGGAFDADS
jgi:hypothetical protein